MSKGVTPMSTVTRILISASLLLLTACASTGDKGEASEPTTPEPVSQDLKETVVSLRDIPCESCLRGSSKALLKIPGVTAAEVERDAAAVRITYDAAKVDEDTLVATVTDLGYAAELGEGGGGYLPDTEFPAAMDVKNISEAGEDVEVKDHLVSGKVTIVDFYAIWCGPCRAVDKKLIEVLSESDDVAVRRINIVDWSSPVAKHYLGGGEDKLPRVIIYGKDGAQVDDIEGFDLDRLTTSIAKARG
jgi:thioredoxin 1